MKRIAVLGGGCGSLSAVWALTREPDWRERYEITVYQLGWRLGGKCASGRNREYGQRIEEHGLHVWAGFYENGFRWMREVYGAVPPDPENPIQSWEDAFEKHSAVMLEEHLDGEWKHWPLTFPENDAVPGTGGELPTPWQYVELIVHWLRGRLEAVEGVPAAVGEVSQAVAEQLEHADSGESLTGGLGRRLRGDDTERPPSGEEADPTPTLRHHAAADLLGAAHRLVRAMHPHPERHHATDHHWLLHLIGEAVRGVEERLEPGTEVSDDLRRLLLLLDFGAATVRGLLVDGVLFRGFEAIDDVEWRTWLARHGARPATIDSAVVHGIYDYVFGFRAGHRDDPQIEAGTATHGMLRLFFTYKGALFWEMQAGMGDIVFAPLYRVLADAGVRFRFFHRVEKLEVGEDGGAVERIRLTRQATVRDGDYRPLVRVRGVPSWPAEPLYEQLEEGEELRREGVDLESSWSSWPGVGELELRRGEHFDEVILGMSLAAVAVTCGDLMRADARFGAMVENVQTVQTGAMQLWLDADAERIGAPDPPRITSAYAQDLNTWSDMTFLLPREDWPGEQAPRYLAYFCGEFPDADPIPPFSDHDFPARELERFRRAAIDWLSRHVGHIWPQAVSPENPDGLDWGLLHDPHDRVGVERLEAQYLRVNIDPTERYVLSLPGTSRHRLGAGESGFVNLVLAGDWVRTSINAGCVEAAVMAGLEAAAALSGRRIEVIGGLGR